MVRRHEAFGILVSTGKGYAVGRSHGDRPERPAFRPRTRTTSATTRSRSRRSTTWPRPRTTKRSTRNSASAPATSAASCTVATPTRRAFAARARRGAARDRLRHPRRATASIPRSTRRREQAVAELFTREPLEEKLRFRAQRHGSVNQGYFPIKETSDIHPDLVEGWVFCRRAFDLDGAARPARRTSGRGRSWSRSSAGSAGAHERADPARDAERCCTYLGCDPHLYDARLTRTNFGLRLNYYPPLRAGGRGVRRRPPARPRGRRPLHLPARAARRGPAGPEPRAT